MTAPLSVLLLEGSAGDARLVAEELRDAGPGVVELARVGTLAAARVRLAAASVDCVLLDLTLPDARDLEAVSVLRDAAPETPVVVLTGMRHDALAVQAVASGALDYLIKGETPGPLLLRAIRCAIERKHAELRTARLAMCDALTGLPARAVLLERARAALDRMGAGAGGGLGLLFLDLDRFKRVNDSLGHHAGDELLVAVAERLRRTARPSDTVARFGGDEFAVLCEDVGAPGELDELAASLSAALAEPLVVAGREIFPGASIGVAMARGAGDSPERLLREADAAMYRAKGSGRDVARFDDAMLDGGDHALRTEAELNHALRRGELVLHYQPQVSLAEGNAIAGVEALVRWRHPQRGLVGPDQFLGTAEDAGLIRRLGAWMLDEACRQLADWRARGLAAGEVSVAVNLSSRELADQGLVALVSATLATHGLPPALLCLEVTESLLLDGGDTPATLRALRDLGVRVAVDDFGTGWSSLSGRSSFPADALKIDRRVVAEMERDQQAGHIVAAAVGLARSLGLQPIAAGVETSDAARALAELGVEVAQGHAFSAACSPGAVEALLTADARREADTGEPVRVFLCDDAAGLRALLRACLERDGDLVVVGEAGDGANLAEAVRAAAADVLLLDLSMPNVDGLEALAELRAVDDGVGVVVLSGFDARRMEAQALALGADRYVEKTAAMREIAGAVREVVAARRGPRRLLEALS
jgi:diguanylate cyclase (GGDEF)-like protein